MLSLVLLISTCSEAGEIHWRSGKVNLADKSTHELRALLRTKINDGLQSTHMVVRFDRSLNQLGQIHFRHNGIRLLSSLGDGAYFATVDLERLNVDRLVGDGRLVDAIQIKPEWKLHPMLATDKIASWTIIGDKKTTNNVRVAVLVQFFNDIPLRSVATKTIAQHGGVVRDHVRSVNTLVVEMPFANIKQLAAEDVVQYIEPPLPQFEGLNDRNREVTGVNELQEPPFGLDGGGVTVLVYDTGSVLQDHVDFTGRLTAHDDVIATSHSTHVAGTLGGDGTGSGGTWRGMAPGVTLESYAFEFGGDDIFLYSNPGDMEANYDEAINQFGAVLANNSIGTNVRMNDLPCEITGDYGITSALIDAMVTGSLGQPTRIVWANGNERGEAGCDLESPGGYHSTVPPACAKNHITVGSVDADTDLPSDFTSWGPADDGRLKPDVSAPGCEIGDDEGVTSCDNDGGYDVKCGTSMSAPTVTGLVALMLQDFRQRMPEMPDPSNATIKAILVHTAQDVVTPGPDYQSGYGSVRAVAAIEQMRSDNVVENAVDQGEAFDATVVVPNGTGEMKITLAWDDVPGTPNIGPALVNDLDLVVFDPEGVQHFPWTLDPANPALPAVRTTADHINNIEQVFVENPMAGSWRVEVRGFDVPFGPQMFSLTASPTLVHCSSEGVASFDSPAYQCSATATVRVVDCDLNTNNNDIETVTAHVASDSAPDGFDILLTETLAKSAAFEADVTLGKSHAGGLTVQHGDTLTLTYVDADTGQGSEMTVTATATVDCVGPAISEIEAADLNPHDATITFKTDEPANATLHYGLSCNALTESQSRGGFRTNHSLRIIDLDELTTYFFAIEATDISGNTSSTQSTGTCLSFATPAIPDYFTERFQDNDNDLDFTVLIFEPDESNDFYSVCTTPIQQFPVDPTGGTKLDLGDDEFATITLTGGKMVRLYGVSYDTIFVGSNGYVTFGEGDNDRTETLEDHFSLPRISGIFDDLTPQNGGTISWRQLPDRVAVTYDQIPEFGFSDNDIVSFQIEMLFNGTIRISYLDIQLDDGLAGLSAGFGLDPDFRVSDLTGYDNCGPLPPVAIPSSVTTPINQSVDIELSGIDMGSPASQLSYAVVSMPNQAILDVATNQVIRSSDLPFFLPDDAPIIRYIPSGGYSDTDSFQFVVNDDDPPPTGGDSVASSVSIQVGGPQVVHSFDLSQNPGWIGTDQWEYGVPQGMGSHSGDPSGGFTGQNVFGYNLAGDYPNLMNETQYLTTDPMNLTGIEDVALSYRRWLGVERSLFDHASIDVSTDGADWTTVWENSFSTSIDDDEWFHHVVDLSNIADDQSTVSLRWGMGPTDVSITYPGWNIDDITLTGVRPSLPPDFDNDGDVDINDFEQFDACRNGSETSELENGCILFDLDQDGDVDHRDFGIFQLRLAPGP